MQTKIKPHIFYQQFKENPKNHRSDIDDVVVLITDGEPFGRRDTLNEAIRYANMLKKKNVRLITAGAGSKSEKPEFIKILKELATSPQFFLKAKFDEMDKISSKLIANTCVKPGK